MRQPQIYSESLSEQILDKIREGKTVATACRELDLPVRTVYGWKGRNVDKFADRYHHATQDRAIAWADEMMAIADDCPPRDIDLKRAALQIRTRQWLIEKSAPTVFNAVSRVGQEDEPAETVSPMDFLKTWKKDQPVAAN